MLQSWFWTNMGAALLQLLQKHQSTGQILFIFAIICPISVSNLHANNIVGLQIV